MLHLMIGLAWEAQQTTKTKWELNCGTPCTLHHNTTKTQPSLTPSNVFGKRTQTPRYKLKWGNVILCPAKTLNKNRGGGFLVVLCTGHNSVHTHVCIESICCSPQDKQAEVRAQSLISGESSIVLSVRTASDLPPLMCLYQASRVWTDNMGKQ